MRSSHLQSSYGHQSTPLLCSQLETHRMEQVTPIYPWGWWDLVYGQQPELINLVFPDSAERHERYYRQSQTPLGNTQAGLCQGSGSTALLEGGSRSHSFSFLGMRGFVMRMEVMVILTDTWGCLEGRVLPTVLKCLSLQSMRHEFLLFST